MLLFAPGPHLSFMYILDIVYIRHVYSYMYILDVVILAKVSSILYGIALCQLFLSCSMPAHNLDYVLNLASSDESNFQIFLFFFFLMNQMYYNIVGTYIIFLVLIVIIVSFFLYSPTFFVSINFSV